MINFVIRRIVLMLATLLCVSILVFLLAQLLPGDIGRAILGRFASSSQVHQLDAQLGMYKPMPERYLDWIGGFLTGHWGDSLLLDVPILPLVFARLWNSVQLGAVAMVIIFPLSVFMGVLAGLRENGFVDKSISTLGLGLTALPEFVSGIILLVLFGVTLRVFPVTAQAPPGSSIPEHIYYLILPAIPLMFVLFGYLAKHARDGTREVVESNYYRTAVLKGLPRHRLIYRHVLPNALLPTITVMAVQVGYLIGGLVVIESLFNYPGIGLLLLNSAVGKDLPVLMDTTVVLGAIIVLSNALADISYSLLNPRIRLAVR